IGSKIGLDDAGVTESRALGGSVLGLGKQISPRPYVGFGVSLLGTGQVLTLKYLLDRGFDIEIESSSVANRGSTNWRQEQQALRRRSRCHDNSRRPPHRGPAHVHSQ